MKGRMPGSLGANTLRHKEKTHQHLFDVETASLSDGHIVYSCAGALRILDLKTSNAAVIPITLLSDFDQLQTH
jgi:tricorn protease